MIEEFERHWQETLPRSGPYFEDAARVLKMRFLAGLVAGLFLAALLALAALDMALVMRGTGS